MAIEDPAADITFDDLIAIDVHTHAEVSCRQAPDPYWQPFEDAANKYFKAPPRPTIAEGTAIAAPIRLPEVVQALRETHGGAVILEEEEIARATLELAGQGLYAEPTSAQAAAGFGRLLREGRIGAAQSTVLLLTGTGVKATPRIAELLGLTV